MKDALWSLSNHFHNINQLHLEIRFTESKANAPFYPKGHLRCLRGVEKTSLPVTLWSLPEWTKNYDLRINCWQHVTKVPSRVPTDTSTSRTSFHSLRKVVFILHHTKASHVWSSENELSTWYFFHARFVFWNTFKNFFLPHRENLLFLLFRAAF